MRSPTASANSFNRCATADHEDLNNESLVSAYRRTARIAGLRLCAREPACVDDCRLCRAARHRLACRQQLACTHAHRIGVCGDHAAAESAGFSPSAIDRATAEDLPENHPAV